jgi:hypothetical protein
VHSWRVQVQGASSGDGLLAAIVSRQQRTLHGKRQEVCVCVFWSSLTKPPVFYHGDFTLRILSNPNHPPPLNTIDRLSFYHLYTSQ